MTTMMMYSDATATATATAELAAQLRELSIVLEMLGTSRADLLPSAATFWGGEARTLYDRAVAELAVTFEATFDLVRLARANTNLALAEVNRG